MLVASLKLKSMKVKLLSVKGCKLVENVNGSGYVTTAF